MLAVGEVGELCVDAVGPLVSPEFGLQREEPFVRVLLLAVPHIAHVRRVALVALVPKAVHRVEEALELGDARSGAWCVEGLPARLVLPAPRARWVQREVVAILVHLDLTAAGWRMLALEDVEEQLAVVRAERLVVLTDGEFVLVRAAVPQVVNWEDFLEARQVASEPRLERRAQLELVDGVANAMPQPVAELGEAVSFVLVARPELICIQWHAGLLGG